MKKSPAMQSGHAMPMGRCASPPEPCPLTRRCDQGMQPSLGTSHDLRGGVGGGGLGGGGGYKMGVRGGGLGVSEVSPKKKKKRVGGGGGRKKF